MTNPQTFEAPTGEVWGEHVCFNILVACEDEACGLAAKGAMARMINLLPFEAMARTVVREFASFGISQIDRAATRPDIVIVASHGSQPLPRQFKKWIEDWAGGSHGYTCALAAVFDRQNQLGSVALETKSYLRSVAAMAGIDWIESMASDESEQYRRDLNQQASTVSSTLEGIIREPRNPVFPISKDS